MSPEVSVAAQTPIQSVSKTTADNMTASLNTAPPTILTVPIMPPLPIMIASSQKKMLQQQQQQCCTNAAAAATTKTTPSTISASVTTATLPELHTKSSSSEKPDQTGPSPLRQLLPVALGLITFATVLSLLIIYMDTTEIRHQQFRLNMSRDYNMVGVPQDDPTLITFIREIHMKKDHLQFQGFVQDEHLNFTESHALTPTMSAYIASLVGNKKDGVFVQSMTGGSDQFMTAPWLAETLNWGGLLVEPEPRKYFLLSKHNSHRPNVKVVHACLSPNDYPKEVSLHHEDDVQINSLRGEPNGLYYNSRVKCFALYTLMLAVNHTNIDLLSLGCQGQELQILQTVPFERVHIQVISIHLVDDAHHHHALAAADTKVIDNATYIQQIAKFLATKSFRLVKTIEKNYIFQYESSQATTTTTTTTTKTTTTTVTSTTPTL